MNEWPDWLAIGGSVVVITVGDGADWAGEVGGVNAAGIWLDCKEAVSEDGSDECSAGWSFFPWAQVLRVDDVSADE